jgi:hypothetical protein
VEFIRWTQITGNILIEETFLPDKAMQVADIPVGSQTCKERGGLRPTEKPHAIESTGLRF